MAFRAYAIGNDMGVLFRDHQLLIFPRKAQAERTRAWLALEDDEFDGRVMPVEIHRIQTKGRAKKP